MSDIIEYSTKVTEETSTQINVEQESLGKSLTPDDYKEVTEAQQQNSTNRKKTLQQNKQKKFHHLKYHRSTPTRQANSATQARTQTETRQANHRWQQTNQTTRP